MKKKHILVVVFIFLLQLPVKAQYEDDEYDFDDLYKTFWISLETGYGIGGDLYGKKRVAPFGQTRFADIRVNTCYYVVPDLSIGMGVGLHDSPIDRSVYLIFLNLRYHPVQSLPRLFVYFNPGVTQEKFGGENPITGFMPDIGLGYKLRISKHLSLNPSIGYNMLLYSTDASGKNETHLRHSTVFRLVFEIKS